MKTLAEQMNDDAWCNYCWATTGTCRWDCTICGFSKPHPRQYAEQRNIQRQSSTIKNAQTGKTEELTNAQKEDSIWENEKALDKKGKLGSTISPDDFKITDKMIEDVKNGKY